MPNTNLTDQEIQNYKIRSIIFLSLMIAGLMSSFYFYMQVQGHHKALDKQNTKLEHQRDSLAKANERILNQSNTIVNLKEHQKQKEQLKEAIDLVQILVNKDADTQLNTEEILAGLTEMAATEKKKHDEYVQKRAQLIENLFASNENRRATARRELSKLYVNDPKLVKDIMATVNKIIFNGSNNRKRIDKYQENISQILYLFTTLSAQNLVSEKKNLEAFFKKLVNANFYAPNGKTMQQIKEIRAKLKLV